WYMVKSGLVDDPRVSSVRLAAHLGLAFLIFASMLWVALGLMCAPAAPARRSLVRHSATLAALVFAMVLSGALVAAIKAGYAYNTFPRMNGEWLPAEILVINPWWMNLIHNMATVQFNHRVLALLIAVVVIALWWRIGADGAVAPRARSWSHALVAAVALQISIGIATLLLRVPVPLAALHQSGALIVFTCAIVLLHALMGAGYARSAVPAP
ncbi:MAG: COX15/CtaA family protein, partial [Usitatibacter sp.]